MDPTAAFAVVLAIIVLGYIWYENEGGEGFTNDSHFGNGSPNLDIGGMPISPAVGEDNPIMQHQSFLINNGLWNPLKSGLGAEDQWFSGLLATQGVLRPSDQARHKLYYGSNVGKYPFVGRATNIDMRVTRNAYVGLTRAMRAVNIRPTESVVPDKLENPVPPL